MRRAMTDSPTAYEAGSAELSRSCCDKHSATSSTHVPSCELDDTCVTRTAMRDVEFFFEQAHARPEA